MTADHGTRVLIGYDGSADARHAIAVCAATIPSATALVVTVWDALPTAEAMALPTAAPPPVEDLTDAERRARRTAEEGADLARGAGLRASHDARQGSGVGGIAETLLTAAEDWDADVIAVGRRGMSRLRAAVLGSIADAVVRSARRPVLVIPAADAGGRQADELTRSPGRHPGSDR